MSWSVIENRKAKTVKLAVPPDHVHVTVRAGTAKATHWRAIEFRIGAKVARQMVLMGEEAGIALLMGGGRPRGQDSAARQQCAGAFSRAQAQGRKLDISCARGECRPSFRLRFRGLFGPGHRSAARTQCSADADVRGRGGDA